MWSPVQSLHESELGNGLLGHILIAMELNIAMQPVLEVILQNEPNSQYGLTITALNEGHISVLRKMMQLNK